MSSELLAVALDAGRIGAAILRENYNKLSVADIDEKGTHDFVTAIDRASEKAILARIRASFPDHGILAEESGYHESDSRVRWIVDPLDGTTNYIHGYPIFAVSIAAEVAGRIEAGVVIDVSREEEFTAARGAGAWLNGNRITVSRVSDLDKALLLTGFPFRATTWLEDFIVVFRDLVKHSAGLRRAGSAAIDLASIACGRADGFWEFGLSAWDLAAGALLIEEAGGIITDIENGPAYLRTGHALCGNPVIHAQMEKIIMRRFEKGHFIGN